MVVAEIGDGFGLGFCKFCSEILGAVDVAHAAPAAAGCSLDQNWVADFVSDLLPFFEGYAAVAAGHDWDAVRLHQLAGRGLVAHFSDGVTGGPDKDEALFGTAVGEVGIFRQKAVSGVDGFASGRFGDLKNGVFVEVAVFSWRRSDTDRAGGQLHVKRVFVGSGIDGHGFDAHFSAGADHADRDFAAVGNEYSTEHGLQLSDAHQRFVEFGHRGVFFEHFENFAVKGRRDFAHHFHRFDEADRVTLMYGVAGLDVRRVIW